MAPQFNDADFAVLISCLKNSSTKLTPDFDKVAQECGLKGGRAAYHRHWAMMRKLGLTGSRPLAAKAKKDSSAAATKKRAATKTEETEDGDVDGDEVDGEVSEETESPTKKAKTSA